MARARSMDAFTLIANYGCLAGIQRLAPVLNILVSCGMFGPLLMAARIGCAPRHRQDGQLERNSDAVCTTDIWLSLADKTVLIFMMYGLLQLRTGPLGHPARALRHGRFDTVVSLSAFPMCCI